MPGISKRVREAIGKMEVRDFEGAFIPLCIATDATAKKEYPLLPRVNARFQAFLREHLEVITYFGTGGFMSLRSLELGEEGLKSGSVPVEGILYEAVRCALLHEAELPEHVTLSKELVFQW
jgi:hypothetical protein